jgi:hypothetical protein
MEELANKIYWFGCVVAATVLGIGVVDYWFGHHQLTAFLSWAVFAETKIILPNIIRQNFPNPFPDRSTFLFFSSLVKFAPISKSTHENYLCRAKWRSNNQIFSSED